MYFQIIWAKEKDQNKPSLSTENFKHVRVIGYIWLSGILGNSFKRVFPHFKRWLKVFLSAYLSSLWYLSLNFSETIKIKRLLSQRLIYIVYSHIYFLIYTPQKNQKKLLEETFQSVLQPSATILMVWGFLGKNKTRHINVLDCQFVK